MKKLLTLFVRPFMVKLFSNQNSNPKINRLITRITFPINSIKQKINVYQLQPA